MGGNGQGIPTLDDLLGALPKPEPGDNPIADLFLGMIKDAQDTVNKAKSQVVIGQITPEESTALEAIADLKGQSLDAMLKAKRELQVLEQKQKRELEEFEEKTKKELAVLENRNQRAHHAFWGAVEKRLGVPEFTSMTASRLTGEYLMDEEVAKAAGVQYQPRTQE